MGINDTLVRRPVRRQTPALFALYDQIIARVCAKYRDALAFAEPSVREAFMDNADAELLILDTIKVEHLAYVREQYWYHMEFQVNLLLAIARALIGLLTGLAAPLTGVNYRPTLEWAAFDVFTLGGSCWFLLRAARKNYRRHVAKMTSLMSAAICGDLKDQSRVAATDFT